MQACTPARNHKRSAQRAHPAGLNSEVPQQGRAWCMKGHINKRCRPHRARVVSQPKALRVPSEAAQSVACAIRGRPKRCVCHQRPPKALRAIRGRPNRCVCHQRPPKALRAIRGHTKRCVPSEATQSVACHQRPPRLAEHRACIKEAIEPQ